jgi:hypothetical protein
MRHRVNTAIGLVAAVILAASMTLALLPAVTASASVRASSGSNPSNPLCQAYRTTLKSDPKSNAASAKASKAIQAGNWKAAQKDLLTAYGYESKDVKNLTSALHNAPSSVQSAVTVLTTYVSKYKTALQSSTSIKQFSKAAQALSKNTKTTAAANTLSKYYTSQCGASGNSDASG